MLAFHDINPLAPVHFMIIPKKHIDSLAQATDGDAGVLGRMMAMAGRQDVYHLHIHIIGGPDPLPRMISKE
jgi:histidine triad (HIT) family protein